MSTPHNEAKLGDIAKTVIMPGDPLRAQYIAENFLDNYRLVNSVRGMYAYTGKYQGKDITIMASGMGIPSMGIYAYELFKFYDVQNIIRIGSCGAYDPKLKLFDIILSKSTFSESNFALTFNNDICHIADSSSILNEIIENTASSTNTNLFVGNTICMDCFDVYLTDISQFLARVPENFNPIAAEMEAFALFYIAKFFNKNATCLMSVVDSEFVEHVATAEERQTGLNNMIRLALDSSLNIN
ncbi:MAG: purine-nucleoside phosphorylase [Clostridia bacterium]|nr:purine-nucleoside phosphorylase [Clostridia bacterium]